MINQVQYAFAVLLFLGGICVSVPASADLCDQDPNCDRITVYGTSMTQMLAMGLSPAYAEPEGQADEIGMDDVVTLFARIIPRAPNIGDPNVNCGSVGEVREAEASQQVAPHSCLTCSMQVGQPFQITYGNGQQETFILTSKSLSLRAQLVPGTCS